MKTTRYFFLLPFIISLLNTTAFAQIQLQIPPGYLTSRVFEDKEEFVEYSREWNYQDPKMRGTTFQEIEFGGDSFNGVAERRTGMIVHFGPTKDYTYQAEDGVIRSEKRVLFMIELGILGQERTDNNPYASAGHTNQMELNQRINNWGVSALAGYLFLNNTRGLLYGAGKVGFGEYNLDLVNESGQAVSSVTDFGLILGGTIGGQFRYKESNNPKVNIVKYIGNITIRPKHELSHLESNYEAGVAVEILPFSVSNFASLGFGTEYLNARNSSIASEQIQLSTFIEIYPEYGSASFFNFAEVELGVTAGIRRYDNISAPGTVTKNMPLILGRLNIKISGVD